MPLWGRCSTSSNTSDSVLGSYAEYLLADPNYVGHLSGNFSFQ